MKKLTVKATVIVPIVITLVFVILTVYEIKSLAPSEKSAIMECEDETILYQKEK